MLRRCVLIAALALLVLGNAFIPLAGTVDAVSTQEDPATAPQVFSAVDLLRFYSTSLDFIINRDQTLTQENLQKMSYANVPTQLTEPVNNFETYGIQFTGSLVDLVKLWQTETEFVSQYRLTEAGSLYQQITAGLPAAREDLNQIEVSIQAIRVFVNIDSLSSQDAARLTFDEVTAKIQQLESILDLINKPLVNSSLAGRLEPTQLILNVNSSTVYVGDRINFSGNLAFGGHPMSFREITLLLDNNVQAVALTDTRGNFSGQITLPYRYVRNQILQAIYYPQDGDAGTYLAAASPMVSLTVLFYETELTIKSEGGAYPGRNTSLSGTIDYGVSPVLARRPARIYLDSILLTTFDAVPNFKQQILLDPLLTDGKHDIEVKLSAIGRYAPVDSHYVLTVTDAKVTLALDTPGLIIIPGSFGMTGKVYSELGPLNNATVVFRVGKNEMHVVTSGDGTFAAKIKVGVGFSLIGNQAVSVQVDPQEPWNALLTTSRNIFAINIVALVIVIEVLALAVLYLRYRIPNWMTAFSKRKTGGKLEHPGLQPSFRDSNLVLVPSKKNSESSDKDANPLAKLYLTALKLAGNLTHTALKPQQTLREYAAEINERLGPAGKYFIALTRIIEKHIYAREQSGNDLEAGKQLILGLQRETGMHPERRLRE